MNIVFFSLFLIATFLWAGIPTGYLAVRIARKEDIRKIGSGNIGATNVKRLLGWGWFAAVLLLDAVKGAVPLAVWLLVRGLPFPSGGIAEVLVAGVTIAGNVFSPWLGFKGGKGVATSLGCLAVLCPVPLLASLGVFIAVLTAFNFVSLASILSAALLPVAVVVIGRATHAPATTPLLVFTILLALVLIARHRENIVRLATGRENKFFSKKSRNT